MDVTSLLNGEPVATEHKRTERPRTQGRSRTPWDAGGYSLPITTRRPSPPPTQPPQTIRHDDDAQVGSPTSSKHGFSDSRSSFSSLVSSITSTTHSRFSSFSTVSSPHPSNSLAMELFSPKPSAMEIPCPSILPSILPERIDNDLHTPVTPLANQTLDVLAPIAENRLSPPLETQVKGEHGKNDVARPGSPSDAILIKRSVIPTLKLDTGYNDVNRPTPHCTKSSQFLSAPLDHHHLSLIDFKAHKRSASAPNIQNIMGHSENLGGAQGEPTPPSSGHPDDESPVDHLVPADTPPLVTVTDDTIQCMYVVDCNTGSQLRKAISHIFGRNKMCTRMIPQHVWVHYCRKHYQRSRYRNPKEYAKLQCDLVQQQIRRVHEWSFDNSTKGLPGVLQDWGLAVRKREQKRLDDMGGVKRKRAASDANERDGEDGEDGDDDNGFTRPPTAVPRWLLELCGKGYSTAGIITIFNRLHNEIIADLVPCLPDIEILPNIYVKEDPKALKASPPKTAATAHKRSQSLGGPAQYSRPSLNIVGVDSDYPQHRRSSKPSLWSGEEPPVQKRRRHNELGEPSSYAAALPIRRRMQLPSRSALTSEHQMGEGRYSEAQGSGYSNSSSPYQVPLLASSPRTVHHPPNTAHNEPDYFHDSRRSAHQRSRSDAGAFDAGRSAYDSPSFSIAPLSACPTDRPRPWLFEGQIGPTPAGLLRPRNDEYLAAWDRGMPSPRQRHGFGHSRHQSSPMGRDYHPISGIENDPRARVITESAQARNIYKSRR